MIWTLLLTACFTVEDPIYDVCEIALVLPDGDVHPGSSIQVFATPLSDRRDTTVRIDGVVADVTSIERTEFECTSCASCRTTNACGACATCTTCDDVCSACEEWFTVEVPDDQAAGTVEISLSNAYGAGANQLLIQPPLPIPTDTATDR